jgi:hypothetical protein
MFKPTTFKDSYRRIQDSIYDITSSALVCTRYRPAKIVAWRGNEVPFVDWDTLVLRLNRGACTPFIGAGASAGFLPLARALSEELAAEYGYPLADRSDLARVSEFVAVTKKDGMIPKEKIAERMQNVTRPNFSDTDEIHRVLADLNLPIYLTTNYDDFMFQALRFTHKDARREVCRWNRLLEQHASNFDLGFDPTPASPVVFHLHGHADLPQSMVVTEDDYLDFLVNTSKDLAVCPTGVQQKALLPLRIRSAITNTTLLFVGYRLADLNFRVILRGLLGSLEQSTRRLSIAVQLKPEGDTGSSQEEIEKIQDYLERYFDWTLNLQVYWGPAHQFGRELRQRLGARK